MSYDANLFVVTRQRPWYQGGPNVVEVARGGLDYAGSDALSGKYPGEFEEFRDPREAVETAIAIRRQWANDAEAVVRVGVGSTGGGYCEIEPTTVKEARRWANVAWEQMEKCGCGKPLPGKRERYRLLDNWDGQEFCSENCAEKEYQFQNTCEDCKKWAGPNDGMDSDDCCHCHD